LIKVITKVAPEEFKGAPQDFLQPKAAENKQQSSQYSKEQHGEHSDIQYACRWVERLQ